MYYATTIPVNREQGNTSIYYIRVTRFIESAQFKKILIIDDIESTIVINQYTIGVQVIVLVDRREYPLVPELSYKLRINNSYTYYTQEVRARSLRYLSSLPFVLDYIVQSFLSQFLQVLEDLFSLLFQDLSIIVRLPSNDSFNKQVLVVLLKVLAIGSIKVLVLDFTVTLRALFIIVVRVRS